MLKVVNDLLRRNSKRMTSLYLNQNNSRSGFIDCSIFDSCARL